MKKPLTSSDSASGRSNGVRLVSLSAEIKKMINIGNNGTTNQIASWYSIILIKLNDPVSKITVRMAELKINSYEIICAVDRNDPRNAYFELADQPANNTPYTPIDEIANVYRIPNEKSEIVNPAPNGITPHPNNLKISVITGAKKNKLFVACAGTTVSLTTSLRASLT